jgi:hypothetical protein
LFAVCTFSICIVGYEIVRAWGIDRYAAWALLGPILAGISANVSDQVAVKVCRILGIRVPEERAKQSARPQQIAAVTNVPRLATERNLEKIQTVDLKPYEHLLDFKMSFANLALLLLTIFFFVMEPWWLKLLSVPVGVITWRRAVTPRDDHNKPQARIDARGVSGIHQELIRRAVQWRKIASCDIVTMKEPSGEIVEVFPILKDKKGKTLLIIKSRTASLNDKQTFVHELKCILTGQNFLSLNDNPWRQGPWAQDRDA